MRIFNFSPNKKCRANQFGLWGCSCPQRPWYSLCFCSPIFNMLAFILLLVTSWCLVDFCTNMVGITSTVDRKKGARRQKQPKMWQSLLFLLWQNKYKICLRYHFKVYNSVVLILLIILCNHHQYLRFCHSSSNLSYWTVTYIPPVSQPFLHLLSVSVNFIPVPFDQENIVDSWITWKLTMPATMQSKICI